MNPQSFPVQWKDKTLYLGELSADVKQTFAQYVKPRALAEMRGLADSPGMTKEQRQSAITEYLQYRAQVAGGYIKWTTDPCTEVAIQLADPAGELYYNRLLFGESLNGMQDDELRELIDAKLADPTSDYAVAMDLIWETANPKVKRGLPLSQAPKGTGNSSTGSPPSLSDLAARMPAPSPTP